MPFKVYSSFSRLLGWRRFFFFFFSFNTQSLKMCSNALEMSDTMNEWMLRCAWTKLSQHSKCMCDKRFQQHSSDVWIAVATTAHRPSQIDRSIVSKCLWQEIFWEQHTYTSAAKVNRLFGLLNNFSFSTLSLTQYVHTIDVLGRVENASTTSGFIFRVNEGEREKDNKYILSPFSIVNFLPFALFSVCMRQKQSTSFVEFRPCSFAQFSRKIFLHRDGLVSTAECTSERQRRRGK